MWVQWVPYYRKIQDNAWNRGLRLSGSGSVKYFHANLQEILAFQLDRLDFENTFPGSYTSEKNCILSFT